MSRSNTWTKEKRREYAKEYRRKNKEKILNYEHNRRPKHTKSQRNKKYWIENKEQLLDYHRKYQKERSLIDPEYALKCRLRSRLYKSLKGLTKSFSSVDAVGCSILNLRKHIESLWDTDMSWDNYGEWHIDHIKPCNSLDLSKPHEIQKCFHYSNLQPLWAKDNLIKSDKILV